MESIAIVGASLAGLRALETLRDIGFDGAIDWIGAEPHLPYERPPLSKGFLAGTVDAEHLGLKHVPFERLDVTLHTGTRAVGLDLADRAIALDTGAWVGFDGLIIATGATPRRLPDQPDLTGVHVLRSLDDAKHLRAALEGDPRVVIIGGGFIGAEVAASCRARGITSVTVLEAADQPMERALGPVIGAELAALHRDHGVDLRCGCGVTGLEHNAVGTVTGVALADGTSIPADVVLVAIGVVPETDWLAESGLTLGNGVECDATLLAAPDVVACGDVCSWPHALFDDERMRLEHWTNAIEQGVAAAQRLCWSNDEPAPVFATVPFVWSDQYDIKIHVVGRARGDDTMHLVHGSFAERSFVAAYERAGRIVGALGFNQPRRIVKAQTLIGARTPIAEAVTTLSS